MLDKQTTDQIRKEAIKHSCISEPYSATSYEAGATAWAVWKQKADVFEKALKEISKLELHDNLLSRDLLYNCIGIATKALEQFKP